MKANRRWLLAGLAAWVASGIVIACVGSDPNPNPPTSSSSGGSSSGGNTDGGTLSPDAEPPRNCPTGCLPPPPAGWEGPSALYDGAEAQKPTACPSAAYTRAEIEAHRGLSAPASSCGCGAAVLSGASCTTKAVVFNSVSDCNNNINSASTTDLVMPGNPCTAGSLYSTQYVRGKAPVFDGGSCTFPNAAHVVPDAAVQAVDVSCALAAPQACNGRDDCTSAPAPEIPFTRVCIHHDGEELCPSADYAVRVIVYKKVDDTRGCSPCVGNLTGSCPNKFGWQAASGACSLSDQKDATADDSCSQVQGSAVQVNVKAIAPQQVACTPTTGAGLPTGELKSSDAVTFCCDR